MRTLVVIWLSTLAWMTASVVAAQDTPPEAMPVEATPAEPVPVEAEPVHDTSEPEVSAVPSGLADAQWGALPDDAALEAAAEPEATDDKPSDNELTIGGRVFAGFQVRDRRPRGGQAGSSGTSYGFVLQQARLRAELRPNKRLRIVVSADFSDALDPTDWDPPPYLRSAYLQFAIEKRWLELRVGRFKRPYSRLELRSSGDLPLRGRGLTNSLIVEDAQWGDRAVGLMLRGRVKPARLRWWLSATNPEWGVNAVADGLDLLARATWDVNDVVEIGINGGAKWTARTINGRDERTRVLAGGVDARVRYAGFELLADVLFGQRVLVVAQALNQPLALGVAGVASYEVPLAKNVRLQPTLFGEWVDADMEFSGDNAARVTFGANLLWKKSFRVMPQLELVRPIGDVTARNQWPASERFTLIFSGQM